MNRRFGRISVTVVPVLLLFTACLEAPRSLAAPPATKLAIVTGKEFDKGMPKDFYVEGNSIPTEKRNAAMLKNANGRQTIFAILDTSGYSSAVQEKYKGMLISAAHVTVCGHGVSIGSYAFGLKNPEGAQGESAKSIQFILYNQGGDKLWDCAAERDEALKQPTPLEAVSKADAVRIYFGRHWIEVK
jgi:hypothetical protein